ncbi:MAG: ABC transporter permease, partial [Acidimicrobiales bacterium]
MSRVPAGRNRTRTLWPSLALPGVVWLLLFFVVPFYGVLAVAFGGLDPIFGNAVPVWSPLQW